MRALRASAISVGGFARETAESKPSCRNRGTADMRVTYKGSEQKTSEVAFLHIAYFKLSFFAMFSTTKSYSYIRKLRLAPNQALHVSST